MDSFLDTALSASAVTSLAYFLAFLILGGAVGWLMAGPARRRHWSASLAIVGVCGAWMGAEFACLFGQAQMGSEQTMVAAVAGAVGLAYAWRRHHPEPSPGDERRVAGERISA
jgi:uncharacterized membrane protein YeaQ/YmgE (transglycosylase-associated protein family)